MDFAATTASLTALYGLIFVLFGAGFLNEARQRQLSYGTLCLGLLLIFPFVTVLVVWLPPSWVFAIVCASTLALWVRLSLTYRAAVVPLIALSARHALTVAAVAFLFWVPGLVGPTSGLFTESGGDFTIYAGLPDKLGDEPLWDVSSREVGPVELSPGGSAHSLSPEAEPPSAGWSIWRIADLGWGSRNPGWYSLQYVLFQGSWGPVELQYLALMAVLWAAVVLGLQRLVLLRYGRRSGAVALLVLASSHGLVAVGYNHYFPQLLATTLVASAAFLLALPPAAALPQAARILVAALCIAFLGIAYYPMLPAAIVPFVLLIGLWRAAPLKRALRVAFLAGSGLLRRAVVFPGAIFLVANVALLYLAQADGISSMLSRFLGSNQQDVAGDIAALGVARPYHLAWFSAVFGGISLQLLPPYSTTDPSDRIVVWGLVAAVVVLVLGLVWVLLRSYRRNRHASRGGLVARWRSLSEESRFRATFLVAFGLFFTVIVVLGRKYEYTQFKALAYVLPFTLLGCVLAACWMRREASRHLRVLAAVAVALLFGSLAAFRLDGVQRFADGREQAAVLDLNVGALARSVREDHPQAFFLAFPAHPSRYSLWEFGLRDERGLILQFFNYPAPSETYVRPADVRNLWVIQDAPDLDEHRGGRTRGDVSAYPAGAAACSVRAGVLHANGESTVAFAPLEAATPMWFDTDVDYWIFGVQHASAIDVLVKEHPALAGRSIAAELLYPVRRKLSVPVASIEQTDAIGWIETAELPASDLVVLRVPGTGYSNVRCR